MKFGQYVTITEKYVRIETGREDIVWYRQWIIENIPKHSGIFIGFRVLQNTEFEDNYEEENDYHDIKYKPRSHVKVALIAINKKQLLYVPITNLVEEKIK